MAKNIQLVKGNKDLVIGPGRKTLVIAEAGVLTFGDKKTGFRFVDEAKKAGIKLLKFQCMVPSNIVHKSDKFWLNRLKQRALSKKDFLEVMKYGKKKGVICFASTHNEYDLIELSDSGMSILKIGSGDSNNFRMIDMAVSTGKPVILSTGLLNRTEINKLLKRYRNNSKQLIVMHCTTIYPTPPELANLSAIEYMYKKFPEYNFGYSDHVEGKNVVLVAAFMKGVSLVEKHFCLPEHRKKPKYDSLDIPPALNPNEFKELIDGIDESYMATSKFVDDNKIFENKKWAHKAICARKKINKGTIIKAKDLMSIRPYRKKDGHIPIDLFDKIVGKRVLNDIECGEYILSKNLKK